ncbi:MAG: O-antigen ligase family protein [Ruminococcus sp.]|nr:O-antigen ligase family protein [Ruminococcus sp.]
MKKIFDYQNLKQWSAVGFSVLMFSVFPFFLTDGFFNIRHDKLHIFYLFSGLLVAVTTVAFVFFDKRTEQERLRQRFTLKDLSVTDWAFVAFALTAVVSTIFSKYRSDAFTGESGRNNGMVLIIFYITVYFLISKNYRENKIVPIIFCVASAGVALLAVLNQFYWDPLNIYAELSKGQYNKFLSTVGNRNILSGFLCLSFPLCFMLYIYAEKLWEKIVAVLCTAINFCGIICSNSDGSILGSAIFLVVALIFFAGRIKYLKRFLFLLAFVILFCKLVRIVSLTNDDYSMGFSTIQHFFVYGNTYLLPAGLCAIMYLLEKFGDKYTTSVAKKVRLAIIIFFSAVTLVLVFAVIYYSVIDTEVKLTGLKKYFRFDDSWGTHRGFMWIRSIYAFGNMNFFQKIFGTGPDTYKLVMDAMGYTAELKKFKHETTDAAHNVYLNYLITVGLAGVGSYITLIVSSIKRAVKSAVADKFVIAFTAGVLCYSVQAVVNIDQPITTPLLILMLALVENGIKRAVKAGKGKV